MLSESAKNWYMGIYQTCSKEELIEEIFKYMEFGNVIEAIKADSCWMSKYEEVSKNLYLLNRDKLEENRILKQELKHKEELLDRALKDMEELQIELESRR